MEQTIEIRKEFHRRFLVLDAEKKFMSRKTKAVEELNTHWNSFTSHELKNVLTNYSGIKKKSYQSLGWEKGQVIVGPVVFPMGPLPKIIEAAGVLEITPSTNLITDEIAMMLQPGAGISYYSYSGNAGATISMTPEEFELLSLCGILLGRLASNTSEELFVRDENKYRMALELKLVEALLYYQMCNLRDLIPKIGELCERLHDAHNLLFAFLKYIYVADVGPRNTIGEAKETLRNLMEVCTIQANTVAKITGDYAVDPRLSKKFVESFKEFLKFIKHPSGPGAMFPIKSDNIFQTILGTRRAINDAAQTEQLEVWATNLIKETLVNTPLNFETFSVGLSDTMTITQNHPMIEFHKEWRHQCVVLKQTMDQHYAAIEHSSLAKKEEAITQIKNLSKKLDELIGHDIQIPSVVEKPKFAVDWFFYAMRMFLDTSLSDLNKTKDSIEHNFQTSSTIRGKFAEMARFLGDIEEEDETDLLTEALTSESSKIFAKERSEVPASDAEITVLTAAFDDLKYAFESVRNYNESLETLRKQTRTENLVTRHELKEMKQSLQRIEREKKKLFNQKYDEFIGNLNDAGSRQDWKLLIQREIENPVSQLLEEINVALDVTTNRTTKGTLIIGGGQAGQQITRAIIADCLNNINDPRSMALLEAINISEQDMVLIRRILEKDYVRFNASKIRPGHEVIDGTLKIFERKDEAYENWKRKQQDPVIRESAEDYIEMVRIFEKTGLLVLNLGHELDSLILDENTPFRFIWGSAESVRSVDGRTRFYASNLLGLESPLGAQGAGGQSGAGRSYAVRDEQTIKDTLDSISKRQGVSHIMIFHSFSGGSGSGMVLPLLQYSKEIFPNAQVFVCSAGVDSNGRYADEKYPNENTVYITSDVLQASTDSLHRKLDKIELLKWRKFGDDFSRLEGELYDLWENIAQGFVEFNPANPYQLFHTEISGNNKPIYSKMQRDLLDVLRRHIDQNSEALSTIFDLSDVEKTSWHEWLPNNEERAQAFLKTPGLVPPIKNYWKQPGNTSFERVLIH